MFFSLYVFVDSLTSNPRMRGEHAEDVHVTRSRASLKQRKRQEEEKRPQPGEEEHRL